MRALVFLLLLLAPAVARADDGDDFDTTVDPASKVTYSDLLRIVFPEARKDPETGATVYGTTAIPVRELTPGDEPDEPEDVVDIGACIGQRVPDGPAFRFVLYVEIKGPDVNQTAPTDHEGALVAVFDDGPGTKLLDLVEVQEDRFVDFGWGGPLGRVGPRTRAFTVYCSHHNSSQGYESQSVLYVHDGRLKRAASVYLLSWRTCSDEVTEAMTMRLRARRGSPLSDVVVTVKVTRRRLRSDCDTQRGRPTVRRYTETYRWNAAKREYVDAGGTLHVVDKLNAASY